MKKFVISASNNENRAHTRRTTISLLKKENEDLKSHIPIFVDMWTFRLKFLIQAEIYAIKKSKGQIVEHGNETLVDLKDIDNQINEVSSPLEKIQILLDNEHLFYLIKMIDPNMKPFPRKKWSNPQVPDPIKRQYTIDQILTTSLHITRSHIKRQNTIDQILTTNS